MRNYKDEEEENANENIPPRTTNQWETLNDNPIDKK